MNTKHWLHTTDKVWLNRLKLSHTDYPCLQQKTKHRRNVIQKFELDPRHVSSFLCSSPRERFCMSITTSVVYINRHSNSILYLPVFWLLAHTTVIIQAASSPAECLYRITRERSLQLTLSKPCFLLWPNSPSIESTLWHNIQEQEKGVISYAVLLQHFASRCSYLSVQLFFLPFTPLRIKHSRVLREESTQICKTKYKSIIIMSQLSS